MNIGLRVDADTLRGTRQGVPELCRVLERHGMRATFFFSVGPDNMGRHLWRLVRPSFLLKMVRSNAPSLYGWDVLLRGTLWPGPRIGERCSEVIRATAEQGHEVGLHAWDHHAWQRSIHRWSESVVRAQLERAVTTMTDILDAPPTCSAAPAWQVTTAALRAKRRLGFEFNSDCRGASTFLPLLGDGDDELGQAQVPTTLPTFDEVVGRGGVTATTCFEHLLGLLDPERLCVLTIHAEVEGGVYLAAFERLVRVVEQRGWRFAPLGEMLAAHPAEQRCAVEAAPIPGRSGWGSWQAGALRAGS